MSKNYVSTLNSALQVLVSAMRSQDKRTLVISENLANIGVKPSKKGEAPYRRKLITFHTVYDKNAKADLISVKKISRDQSPFQKFYSPNDPAADKNGYVEESNVNAIIELSDMKEASRAYDACLKALERTISMTQSALSLLK